MVPFFRYVESKRDGLKIIPLKKWGVDGIMLSAKKPFAFCVYDSIPNHPDDFLIPILKNKIQRAVRIQGHFAKNLRNEPLGLILLIELLDGGFSVNVSSDWMQDSEYVYIPTSNLKPI